MRALCRYSWPGNVRELENLIERSVIISQKSTLEVPLAELQLDAAESLVSDKSLVGMEREHILRALQASNWVIAGSSGAAVRLGLPRTSLQYKMQKLGITEAACDDRPGEAGRCRCRSTGTCRPAGTRFRQVGLGRVHRGNFERFFPSSQQNRCDPGWNGVC